MGTDSDPSSSSKRTIPEAAAPEASDVDFQPQTASIPEPGHDLSAQPDQQSEDDLFGSIVPLAAAMPGPEKLAHVDTFRKTPFQVNDVWYLVARDWYIRWRRACSDNLLKEGPLDEKDLGPVDNSSLLDNNGNLVTTCVEGVDVEFVPADVWSLLETW